MAHNDAPDDVTAELRRNGRPGRHALLVLAGVVLVGACQTSQQASTGFPEDVDPERVMGLTPTGVVSLLGEPELRRSEPPAEVWQYRSDTCVFDVYLVTEAGQTSVVYYETRPRAEGSVQPPRCVGEIVAGRSRAPATT